MSSKRVLHVTSELVPYFPENPISSGVLNLAKQMFSQGNDVRLFMPRFGSINERRFQLHEVIRLSGMNLIINDLDQPLIIKVASLPNERMQVYFTENQDYFKRKTIYKDETDCWSTDNDERSIFFAKGVLETIKKLNWKPDIIHVHGWMANFLPIYLKQYYKEDSFFNDIKIALSIYNQCNGGVFSENLPKILEFDKIDFNTLPHLKDLSYEGLVKTTIENSDLIIKGEEIIDDNVEDVYKAHPNSFEFTSNEDIISVYDNL